MAFTIFRIVLLSLGGAALFACNQLTLNHPQVGYKRVFLRGVPQGEDAFSVGWRDGCDTALATTGAGTLMLTQKKMDGFRLENEALYRKGYSLGNNYCTSFLDWDTP